MDRPNKDQLSDLYLRQKMNTDQIAALYGVTGRSVRYWMTRFDIKLLGPSHLRLGVSATWNIGAERDSAYRAKQRASHLGKIAYNKGAGNLDFVCEVCGNKVSDKPYRRKRTCSKACKDALSSIHKGENHWNYKGDESGTVQRRRGWVEYKEWRKNVISSASYTCQKCRVIGGKLTAHHIYSWSAHPLLRFDPANGACLCWICHWSFHRSFGHKFSTRAMFDEWLTM